MRKSREQKKRVDEAEDKHKLKVINGVRQLGFPVSHLVELITSKRQAIESGDMKEQTSSIGNSHLLRDFLHLMGREERAR